MTEDLGGVRPASNGPATARRSYCRRDGWLCTPENRCDEHRRGAVQLGQFLFYRGGDFIFGDWDDADDE